ncbi:hypothetical protein D3C78_1702430 [compost metagenome]
MLVTQADTVGKRLKGLGVQRVFNVWRGPVQFGGAVQVSKVLLVIHHFPEGFAGHTGFFNGHVVTLVHQREPVDFVIRAVVQNPAGPAHTFG